MDVMIASHLPSGRERFTSMAVERLGEWALRIASAARAERSRAPPDLWAAASRGAVLRNWGKERDAVVV
jgi:hypothetical protein